MITCKEFVKHLKELKQMADDIDSVHSAMQKLDPDFGGFYFGRAMDKMFELLALTVGDKHEYLTYWALENDWGKGIKKDSVTHKNGKPIPLKTPEQLYDAIKRK